jgi:hypothetical protein
MTDATSLEVRNGAWVHVRVGDDPDDRSGEQQTRDRLLRDLALAIHYDRIMPSQGEHVPLRSSDAEPYTARVDAEPGQSTAAMLREIRALLGEQTSDEILAAATHLAETKPGQ